MWENRFFCKFLLDSSRGYDFLYDFRVFCFKLRCRFRCIEIMYGYLVYVDRVVEEMGI